MAGLSDADVGLADPQQAAQQQAAQQQPQMLPGAKQPLPAQATPNLSKQTGQVGLSDEEVGLGQPPTPQNSWSGAGKAVGQGLVDAASGIAGLPGDITSLVTGGKHGTGFGSEAIQKGIEGYTGHYDPQTRTEKYLRTGASFLPGAALPAGELGIGARLLRMVAAPAIGSETAGELTEGTPYEPYARIAGGVAGGYLGNKIGNLASASKAPAALSSDQISQAATAGYQSPNLARVSFKDSAIDDLQNKMRSATLNQQLAPTTHNIIDMLDNPIGGKANATWEDVQTARTLLGQEAGRFSDPVAQGAAMKAKGALDGWLDNLSQGQLQSGDANLAVQTYRAANRDYAVKSALNALSGKEYAADLSSAAANSGANYENALRQRIKGILVSPAQRAQFAQFPGAIEAMEDIVRGGFKDNSLRVLGNLMGGGGGMLGAMHGMAGFFAGAGPAGFAVPATGAMLKGASNRIINNKVGRLSDMIAQAAPASAKARTQAILSGALNAPRGMSLQQRAMINALLSRQPATQ